MTSKTVAAGWAVFAIVSAFFFLITASTFSSLGVVLPFMIEELAWSWSEAGAGFSLFAVAVGLAGTFPAWTLRRFGAKATYAIGGTLMAIGFARLATAGGLFEYYPGTVLLGIGYAASATVPAVHLLNGWMPDKRSFAIGAYMTIGGLGAVAGPLAATTVMAATESWRVYWWLMSAAILFLVLLSLFLVKSPPENSQSGESEAAAPDEESTSAVHRTRVDWRFRDAIRTRQFFLIAAALTMTLLCALTMNSWAFTHMGALGIPAGMAAAALSADGAINALSRAVGGGLANRIDPKWLLVAALIGEAIGMVALSVADNLVALTFFAIGEGFGFGMCFFATTMLLINYFGTKDNPEILGTFNILTTVAMIGPVLGGMIADRLGSFSQLFQAYAVILLVIIIATALMQPPVGASEIEDVP